MAFAVFLCAANTFFQVQCKFDYFLNHLLIQGAKTKPKFLGLVVFDSWSSAKASNCQAEVVRSKSLKQKIDFCQKNLS